VSKTGNLLKSLKAAGVSAIRTPQLRKLLACARKLGEVEKYTAMDA
jgi:hypothetical protein